jgi:EAL domain-containing protein (putative c-di-GMP-specific phosphodiesterase class I)
MGYERTFPAPLHLLLLGTSPHWIGAVHAALATLGKPVPLETVASAAEAVRLLAPSNHVYSHLLLQPGLAGDMMATLMGLTAGEGGSGVGLIVLGAASLPDAAPAPAHVQFVPEASSGWLARALAAPLGTAPEDTRPALDELRAAVSSDRVQARYQPLVRMADRVPVGLEVLARIDHPIHGTIGPDLFVPQIEAAGLSRALTETMIVRACQEWSGEALAKYGLTIALNVPLDVLLAPPAMIALEEHRAASSIPAERIVIELTETQPLDRLEELRVAVTRLRKLGYRIAIDDVGPDVRDHSPLLDLPFTSLKLDKGVVLNALVSKQAEAFLIATIEGARRSGFKVVAEGIETEEIWARMVAAGVDEAQGFLIARPLPFAAVPAWHAQWCARFVG